MIFKNKTLLTTTSLALLSILTMAHPTPINAMNLGEKLDAAAEGTPRTIALRANFQGSDLLFEEHLAVPDGDCGFHVLAVRRERAFVLLFAEMQRDDIRSLVAPEIKTAFIGGDSFPHSLQEKQEYRNLKLRQQNPLEANNPDFDAALSAYCMERDVYLGFVRHALYGRNWLTCVRNGGDPKATGILDAIAALTDKKVYVWQKRGAASELEMVHESPHPGTAIHMLHTDDGTHFNLLSILLGQTSANAEGEREGEPGAQSAAAVVENALPPEVDQRIGSILLSSKLDGIETLKHETLKYLDFLETIKHEALKKLDIDAVIEKPLGGSEASRPKAEIEELKREMRELRKTQVPPTEGGVREIEAIAAQAIQEMQKAREDAEVVRRRVEECQQEIQEAEAQLGEARQRESSVTQAHGKAVQIRDVLEHEVIQTSAACVKLLQETGESDSKKKTLVLKAATTAQEAYDESVHVVETHLQELKIITTVREVAETRVATAKAAAGPVVAEHAKKEAEAQQKEKDSQDPVERARIARQGWEEKKQIRAELTHSQARIAELSQALQAQQAQSHQSQSTMQLQMQQKLEALRIEEQARLDAAVGRVRLESDAQIQTLQAQQQIQLQQSQSAMQLQIQALQNQNAAQAQASSWLEPIRFQAEEPIFRNLKHLGVAISTHEEMLQLTDISLTLPPLGERPSNKIRTFGSVHKRLNPAALAWSTLHGKYKVRLDPILSSLNKLPILTTVTMEEGLDVNSAEANALRQAGFAITRPGIWRRQ